MTSLLFAILVVFLFAAFGALLVRHSDGSASKARVGGSATLVYLILPAVLALGGLLDSYDPVPRPMVVVVLVTGITVWIARSPLGARLARTTPLALLVGFQAFRIPVELLLHQLWKEGQIPQAMTFTGWNFDIASGITAGILGVLLAVGRVDKRVLMAWNVAGLLLLITIIIIAVLATPVFDPALFDGPLNTLPGTFPYIWLPTVLVQLALLGHLLLFRRLGMKDAAV